MGRITATRRIKAPIERVFEGVAHIENFQKAVPDIVRVEFVSESRTGVGTRFRETRRMGSKEVTVELEVTDYVANESVRIVSDAGGTIWDTTFRVSSKGDGEVELAMEMEDKAYKLLARIFNPRIRPMVRKGVESDLDAVKAFCEAGVPNPAHTTE